MIRGYYRYFETEKRYLVDPPVNLCDASGVDARFVKDVGAGVSAKSYKKLGLDDFDLTIKIRGALLDFSW